MVDESTSLTLAVLQQIRAAVEQSNERLGRVESAVRETTTRVDALSSRVDVLGGEIVGLRTEVKHGLADLRTEFKTDLSILNGRMLELNTKIELGLGITNERLDHLVQLAGKHSVHQEKRISKLELRVDRIESARKTKPSK